jgi:hypothetical protein
MEEEIDETEQGWTNGREDRLGIRFDVARMCLVR